MSPVDDGRLLAEVLHRIADRAEPAGDLAERAVRRTARRRRTRAAAVLAAAAAVAAPLLLFGGGETVRPAPPAASADQAASPAADERWLVNACMRYGPPTGNMGGPDLKPRKGMPSEHRILVSTKAGAETVALLGGPKGFILCAVQDEVNTEPPTFRPWPGDTSRGLTSFPGKLRIDAADHLTRVGEGGRGSSQDGLHHLVTGRYKPGVVRIEVVWNRGRRADAVLRGGHFLARVDSRYDENDDGSMTAPKDRIRSITAFDTAGEVLQIWKAPGKGLRGFDPAACRYDGKPDLCSD
ncbi:hypothetical protein [Actinocorallia libanotica]|uniref:Uncharacterized protein n=1 Tax=Actinocorallia libanotica TaxID=46162 RepID=A0ABP4BDA4_9ACTN